jgi:glutamate-1-semialdehyde 2,1-aminomutase
MPAETINLKLLEDHARQTEQARSRLIYHRFDPHLQQPIFGNLVLPKFSTRASGCRIWDILGNQFIDWTGSSDSNLFGHRHPAIVEAIKRWAVDTPTHQLDQPASCDGPLTDPRELKVADRLAEVFGADFLVGFTRGRSEAMYSAVEMARTLTGRPMIAVHEVHSTRSLFAEDQRFRFSRSHFEEANVKTIPADDIKTIQWLLKSNPEQVAAVVLGPPAFDSPSAGYFRELSALLESHGTLLILDESETAFRLEIGGAKQYYSIQPDVIVTGEKLGGPFAFSAVLGRKEVCSRAWRSTMKTVDRPGGLTLEVVEAALDVALNRCLPSELKHTGAQLQDEFNDAAKEFGAAFRLVGHPTRLAVSFEKHDFLTPDQLRSAFCMAALEEGIITHGEFWPNAAHDDDSLFDTIRALERTMKSVSAWMSGLKKPEEAVGEPFSKYTLRGRIDSLNMIRKTMVLAGWILIDGQPVELSAVLENGDRIEAENVQRDDLEAGMPNYPRAAEAGFKLSLPVDSIKKPSRFLIEGHQDGQLLYRTLLVHDPAEQTTAPYPFGDGYLFT